LSSVSDRTTPGSRAFGNKKTLFDHVIDAYTAEYGRWMQCALSEEPSAQQAIARLFQEAAVEHTRPGRPPGCLLLCAGRDAGDDDVTRKLTSIRHRRIEAYAARIEHDIEMGLLPRITDPAPLARYIGVVLGGMSDAARDGASREELEQIAALAMCAWPANPTRPRT